MEIDTVLMVEEEIDTGLMVVAEIDTGLRVEEEIGTDLMVVGHHIVVHIGLGLLLHKAAVAGGEGNYIVD